MKMFPWTRTSLPLALTAALNLSCAEKRQLSPQQAKIAAMDSMAERTLVPSLNENTPVAGISLAVFQGEQPLLVKGYGYADLEKRTPVNPDTIFRIGSITKQFTAAGIMALVEDGRLNLDDPLFVVLPEVQGVDHSISIRHLLSHTSGIENYTALPEWPVIGNRPMSREELAHVFSVLPLKFRPGDKFAYSNSNYYLLGMVIEKVSGAKYQDFIQQRLIAKARLKNTSYCPPEQNYPQAAQGYTVDGEGRNIQAEPLIMDHAFASGALCSTARDLVQWTMALAKGHVIRPESYQLMKTPYVFHNGDPTTAYGYGFGLGIGEEAGRRYIGHGGSINGFASLLDYYPNDELIVAVLVNTESSVPDDLGVSVARVGLGLEREDEASAD
jgi:CubicO group peptidase (beta-lactamase class C family)